MGIAKRTVLVAAGMGLVIYGFLGCSGSANQAEPKVECSTLFVPPDHKASVI